MINWHNRYAKLLQRNLGLFDPSSSVLEVGGGLHGIAVWLQRPIVGLEPEWGATTNPFIEPVHGDVRSLPFARDSFDYVVCVDVLEHLAEGDRRIALQELVRVSRGKILVACPCGVAARQGEFAFADLLRSVDIPLPDWLEEHFENVLPEIGELVHPFIDSGYSFEITGNENLLQHYAGLLLDMTMPLATEWHIRHAAKTVFEPPLGESAWDEYYSYLFTVDKRRRRHDAAVLSVPSGIRTSDSEPTVAIYAVAHDASTMEDIAPLRYICTGDASTTAATAQQIPPLVDRGHLPNSRWSELSAIYSIWKDGPVTDVVGFCHYRRFFNFGSDGGADREQTIERSIIDAVKADFSAPDLMPSVHRGLVVVARPIDLGMTVFENYSRCHNANDYLLMLGIVSESCPELLPFLAEDFASHEMYGNNMFIMNWELFDRMCSTWFPALQEFCMRVDARKVAGYQARDVSFISERLFSAWVKYAKSQGVQIQEQPIYFVDYHVESTPPILGLLADTRHEPAITVAERLRAVSEVLEAERARVSDLVGRLEAERARVSDLLGNVDTLQQTIQRLTDELATMKASEAWQLSQRLRSSVTVRYVYGAARRLQGRLRRS